LSYLESAASPASEIICFAQAAGFMDKWVDQETLKKEREKFNKGLR